ncbi:MAG: hypothetical protein A2X58_01415 [Nitrospirae bacterium GWC2_56_14]|nr:MAG: hypothetical protein A2X58_01415 [Nitrospirae bacterium GWC2_56_14]
MPEVRIQKSEVRKKLTSALIGIVVIAIATWAGDASAMLTAKANHDHITIDFFYHGSTVSVKGLSEPGTDLVVKITSPEGHQLLKKKGKVGGMLWMNVGQLKFENTPNFYEVFSTRKIEDILSTEEMDRHVIGFPALAKHVEITPVENEAEKAKWFDEFVKFKEDSRVYTSSSGNIKTSMNADGKQEYFIMTDWPYQAQPGDYLVTVYAVKDLKVVEQATAKVNVEQVGMVKSLAGMAKDMPAMYGFLSIGVALGAGFGVSMVFRKGGGAH